MTTTHPAEILNYKSLSRYADHPTRSAGKVILCVVPLLSYVLDNEDRYRWILSKQGFFQKVPFFFFFLFFDFLVEIFLYTDIRRLLVL